MDFKQKSGMLSFVLQAHLPFVRHPEQDRFLEENWYFEALSETYLPLLRVFRGLEEDNIPFFLTLSLSPTLLAMMEDDLLKERYLKHLDLLLELAEKEHQRLLGNPAALQVVEMYRNLYQQNRDDFTNLYDGCLVKQFLHFFQKGNFELITTTATHAFLPMYQNFPSMIHSQVLTALDCHQDLFQQIPKGFWLPECGYFPGLEKYLKAYGIQYFFSSAHGILHAEDCPRYGVYSPVSTPNGLMVFPRDRAASRAVWSAKEGFPGSRGYRDFNRDIGFDLPVSYIGPYALEGGNRVNTGFKYYAIREGKEKKKYYDPPAALAQVQKDAQTFLDNRIIQGNTLSELMDRPPLVVCPYDAEIFGHWWFEGVAFLDAFFRLFHQQEHNLVLTTPTRYLSLGYPSQTLQPVYSSWGEKGYGQVWLDGSNDWVYRHVHKVIERMSDLVKRFPDEKGIKKRTLDQAAREVLLAQASDWPFIMKTGKTVPYARERIKSHIYNFNYIYNGLCHNSVKTEWLTELEKKNNIFPRIDYRIFKEYLP